MDFQTLTFTQSVKASPKDVYRAFTNATSLREWFCDAATVVPHPGGRLYLWWNSGYYTCGEFISTKVDEEVSFSWFGKGEPSSSIVRIVLKPQPDGTLISLDHSNLGTGEEWSKSISEIKKGWKIGLENLVSVLETGEDQRFTRRPMLGITVGDFSPEQAEALSVPVTEGLRLDSVVEGMGAQAAGLQPNDIIISLAGCSTTDGDSLANALRPQRAGDTIEIIFYRGPEKKSIMMKLSARPIHNIPPTAIDLYNEISKRYSEIEDELSKFLTNVTEEQASYKPDPHEWSIKENIAHLLQGECGYQFWIDELIGGHERVSDDWGGNIDIHNEATVVSYGSLTNIFDGYKRAMLETKELIRRLPEDFVARKGSYWRFAYAALEEPYHFRSHIAQMQTVLDAARKQSVKTK